MADFNFSVFSRASRSATDASELTSTLESALRIMGQSSRWRVMDDGTWCHVAPDGYRGQAQGWKLHLSATLAAAQTVLARSLPVLLAGNSAFKFASTIHHVDQLNARTTPRGHSGKFITIYPESDDEAVRLAETLHRQTMGLPGPRILSDRPYAESSLVHYRYGAFVEERRISNDGLYAWVIFDPDGNPVEDQRVGRYVPPPWARCPFPNGEAAGTAASRSSDGGVVLGDRFSVRAAVRHLNKGSVYRGVDTQTGTDVIIKEARPYVAADETGRDVRDLLRAEARALEKIAPFGIAPRPLLLFEQSQHVFLAEELVPGVPLHQWVLDQIREGGWRRHVPAGLELAERLVELMDAAHRGGLVLRDFNPNNIMVRPDGQLRLIDLELAMIAGAADEVPARSGTPGYSAPEQFEGAAVDVTSDYYSLGASICFAVIGSVPYFLEDVPPARPFWERLAEWLAVREEALDIPADVRTLVLGLMDDDPARRWTPPRARNALAAWRESPERPSRTRLSSKPCSAGDGGELTDDQWHQAVDGTVGYLLSSMNPDDAERLWPAPCLSGAPDPCIVQLGAAGVVRVLTAYLELTGDQRLPGAIATAGRWMARRLRADTGRPPGLYFGQAGIAWSLYEAGRGIGDDGLAAHGLELAGTLPVTWSNPDITHGTAGLGLTFLHLWRRTGEDAFAERAGQSADALIASASDGPDGLIWGTPAAFESRLAGGRYYGFAHGTAGVGYFLLATAMCTGRSDCLELAYRAGETLLAKATVAEGTALWGAGPGDRTTAPYWCHGSAGIGMFLTRLHRATGDDRFGKMADLSVQAVMENVWRGVLGQCHGLAGNGEFLLDTAETHDDASGPPAGAGEAGLDAVEASGPPAGAGEAGLDAVDASGREYRALARRLAWVLFASRSYREGGMVFPDEHGELSAAWAHGVAGILSFLLRLRFGSPRLWMVDPLLEQSRQS